MRIIRNGSERDRGSTSINLVNSRFGWERSNRTVSVRASWVQDFSGTSQHNYEMQISIPEIAELAYSRAE